MAREKRTTGPGAPQVGSEDEVMKALDPFWKENHGASLGDLIEGEILRRMVRGDRKKRGRGQRRPR